MNYRIAPLDETLSRREFDCGVPALNRYLHERAGQDIRKYYTAVFVAIETSTKKILGYYTLSNASVNLGDIPEHLKKALPKYAEIPAIRLGRVAVDISARSQRLGSKLLADAMLRSMANVSAWTMMVVDAKDEQVCRFYEKSGFSKLDDDTRRMYIMRRELDKFVSQENSGQPIFVVTSKNPLNRLCIAGNDAFTKLAR
ncbi:hypothetical protein FACS1894204_10000 [Synergistales bacterium]|nr:hypothetical protein FACS1894204_10000 [Synergistales bacterium]